MKNPANPGDFGTNGTRGVVGSGMSETTKSADCPIGIFISITQTYGRDTTEFEKLAFAHLLIGAKMRAAEGGAERETTNSPAEIGSACTGRKWTVDFSWLCIMFLVATIAEVWWDAGFCTALEVFSAVWWWEMFQRKRASGGDGV